MQTLSTSEPLSKSYNQFYAFGFHPNNRSVGIQAVYYDSVQIKQT